MISMTGRRTPLLFVLAAVLTLSLSGAALAHNGEAHPAQTTTTTATTTNQPNQGMSDMPMQGSEMAWPTEAPSGGMSMGMHHERPTTMMGRTVAWMGAWHPAAVHFPVALLLTVAFLELAAIVRRKPIYTASNKLLLGIATVAAFVTAPLGWADAGLPTPQDEWFLIGHRWLGTAIPFVILLLWRLKAPADQAAAKPSPPYYEVLLVVSVLMILAQAYLGADITHGEDHMAF